MEICRDVQFLEIIRGEGGQEFVHEEFVEIVKLGVDFFRLVEGVGFFWRRKTFVMATGLIGREIYIVIFFLL